MVNNVTNTYNCKVNFFGHAFRKTQVMYQNNLFGVVFKHSFSKWDSLFVSTDSKFTSKMNNGSLEIFDEDSISVKYNFLSSMYPDGYIFNNRKSFLLKARELGIGHIGFYEDNVEIITAKASFKKFSLYGNYNINVKEELRFDILKLTPPLVFLAFILLDHFQREI